MSWPARKLLTVAFALGLTLPSAAQADPLNYFPSVPVHEDDGLRGVFDLNADGCFFELTRYAPSRVAPHSIPKTRFDLSRYDTDPARVNAPLPSVRQSSRHTIVWFASDMTDADLDPVNTPLRDARLTFDERRNMDLTTAREKQTRLTDLLARIDAGRFGTFAAQNHTVTYVVEGVTPEITGVFVARAVHLPVRRDDGLTLVNAMHAYRLANCPES